MERNNIPFVKRFSEYYTKLQPFHWSCSWCNGYRRRKWTRWHEFKSWPKLITFHIALIPLGKVWIQLLKWRNSEKEVAPSPTFIEKGDFGSSSTMVAIFNSHTHTHTHTYIYIYIYIYIILSSQQHGYPWSSIATLPYRSSLLAGPQGYIPYRHRAAVFRFELVALLLLGHVRGSIGEHHLCARPCFSSSVLHVWFV